ASDNFVEHLQTTADVLEELNSISIPIIKVFNKIDRISPTRLLMLEKMYPEAVFVAVINSAENGHDNSSSLVDIIRQKILHFFDERMKTVTIRLDYLHSQKLANIYEWSRVDNIDYQEEGIMMTLTTIPGNLERLRHHLGSGFTEMS
ncbi:hypothetical protein OAJ98_05770, partial [Deltaproteobacteria bacterium]|nr:hypothetical protein [Deltaproteobacteria bacterium]